MIDVIGWGKLIVILLVVLVFGDVLVLMVCDVVIVFGVDVGFSVSEDEVLVYGLVLFVWL